MPKHLKPSDETLPLLEPPSKAGSFKRKLGYFLFAIVLFCWVAVPILPFFDFPYKAASITVLLVLGEVLFFLTLLLLGREFWEKTKADFRKLFSWEKPKA